MISPEEFAAITDSVKEGNALTIEQSKELLQSLYEMDANLVIIQNALELTVNNSQEIIPAVAEAVLSMSGRTDKKFKAKVAKYAGEVTARFEVSVHLYLKGAFEQAEEILGRIAAGEDVNAPVEEETSDVPSAE